MTDHSPLRVLVVGGGGMGQHWLRTLADLPDADVVGLIDIDLEGAKRARDATGFPELPVGTSVTELATSTGADAVINATVPIAHHPVSVEAMMAGLPVLCEKPITPTVSEALSLAATSEATGVLLMTSQSRRYYDSIESFRSKVRMLGPLGVATTEFFRDPQFGGFRTEMDNPLLVDMSIHAFDAARYVLDAEPVAVYCEAFNPAWSYMAGSAATAAVFEMSEGIRYIYTGNWVAPGLETSWNGQWRVSGQHGTALWDGEAAVLDHIDTEAVDRAAELPPEWARPIGSGHEIQGSFAEFARALRTGLTPSGEIHDNVASLAMVEAAISSASLGTRVLIADVIERAYCDAVDAETLPGARERLLAWGSGSAGLSKR